MSLKCVHTSELNRQSKKISLRVFKENTVEVNLEFFWQNTLNDNLKQLKSRRHFVSQITDI